MRRPGTVLVAKCLLAASLSTAATGCSWPDDPSAGPVVLGGRIEVAGAGVALGFPPRWYAFDLTHPNLLAEMEAFDENTARNAPMVASMSYERAISNLGIDADDPEQRTGAELIEELVFSQAASGAREAEGACYLVRSPALTESVEEETRMMLGTLEAPLLDVTRRVELPSLDAPGGRMGRSEVAALVNGEETHAAYFLLIHEGWTYTLQCLDSQPYPDGWLAIAETFEFLPVEE